jgi:hypothetical protein
MIVMLTDWSVIKWFRLAYGEYICVGVMLGEDGVMYRAFEEMEV